MKRNENYVAPAISVRSTRIRCSILAGSNISNGTARGREFIWNTPTRDSENQSNVREELLGF